MNEIPGFRSGSKLYEYNGFVYIKNKFRGTCTYYRCREEHCGVTSKVVGDEVTINGDHEHGNANDLVED